MHSAENWLLIIAADVPRELSGIINNYRKKKCFQNSDNGGTLPWLCRQHDRIQRASSVLAFTLAGSNTAFCHPQRQVIYWGTFFLPNWFQPLRFPQMRWFFILVHYGPQAFEWRFRERSSGLEILALLVLHRDRCACHRPEQLLFRKLFQIAWSQSNQRLRKSVATRILPQSLLSETLERHTVWRAWYFWQKRKSLENRLPRHWAKAGGCVPGVRCPLPWGGAIVPPW